MYNHCKLKLPESLSELESRRRLQGLDGGLGVDGVVPAASPGGLFFRGGVKPPPAFEKPTSGVRAPFDMSGVGPTTTLVGVTAPRENGLAGISDGGGEAEVVGRLMAGGTLPPAAVVDGECG